MANPNVGVRAAAGLSHLLLHAGAEITDLVAEMHAVIARTWLPFDAPGLRAIREPFPYRVVRGSFAGLARLASILPRGDDARPTPETWRRIEGALNGVIGDKLAAAGNALAIPMSLRGADGAALDRSRPRGAAGRGTVLFVHGLCVAELEWHSAAHDAFVGELEGAGYLVGWLRYNSGRAIADNGRELAELLETGSGDVADQPLILIGHSMGGLVIRSACHWAAGQRHGWLQRLTHAAYLGSPHHGAPWERAGNYANALLGRVAYSAPFMRLGNVRSRGIKDLRFGCITAEESAAATDTAHADCRQRVVPLPEHVHHLLVAASLKPPAGQTWLGDGLVPVPSALGEHRSGALSLCAPRLERVHLSPLGHIALMSDARVYATLREWVLSAGSGPVRRGSLGE
jgi:hypothetical protein